MKYSYGHLGTRGLRKKTYKGVADNSANGTGRVGTSYIKNKYLRLHTNMYY